MKYYLLALENYFTFRGRSNRSEYWYFALFHIIFAIAAFLIDYSLDLNFSGSPYGLIYSLYAFAVLIPGLAVTVRRLHDVNKSGWFFLISLIPLIGAIWLLVQLATKGTEGENQFGPDPNGNAPLFDFEQEVEQIKLPSGS